MSSCEPRALTESDVFVSESSLDQILANENPQGYKIFDLEQFLDTFMTEQGNFWSDTSLYRQRSHDSRHDIYLYTVDTLPTNGRGIYIRGRITTDDYAGNFYKAMSIQQIVDGAQQNLRISVDLGSSGGMYQMGQEILIRCNGLAVGRYANQPQLCVPAYNNNIFAMNASEKVGWAPGRIQGSVFRRATKMIGTPDQSKLVYDTLTLIDLYSRIKKRPSANATDMDAVRKIDGLLVVLKDVHFNGKYNDQGTVTTCVVGNPDTVSGANVFAPSTQNIGYPQSRFLEDQGGNMLLCSTSEYAKYAYYYLPGADKSGVANCSSFEGTVTGLLGWYLDKAETLQNSELTGYEWSVTPRGIPTFGVEDIKMYYQGNPDAPWDLKEYDPNEE